MSQTQSETDAINRARVMKEFENYKNLRNKANSGGEFFVGTFVIVLAITMMFLLSMIIFPGLGAAVLGAFSVSSAISPIIIGGVGIAGGLVVGGLGAVVVSATVGKNAHQEMLKIPERSRNKFDQMLIAKARGDEVQFQRLITEECNLTPLTKGDAHMRSEQVSLSTLSKNSSLKPKNGLKTESKARSQGKKKSHRRAKNKSRKLHKPEEFSGSPTPDSQSPTPLKRR